MKREFRNGFFVFFAAILIFGLVFSGCKEKKSSNSGGLTEITMATNPFVGNAPIYVAIEKGFFEDEGIKLSLVNFDDSSSSLSALISNNVDLAYGTLDSVLIAESQYSDDKLKIPMIVDESYGADGILVKNDISSISDLKGKTVAVSVNQTTHYLLLQALKNSGISDKDLNLVNMTSSDAGVAFITGGVDAAVTWEPYLSNAVSSGAGKMIFSSADAPGSICDVLAILKEDSDAAWLGSVTKAYDKGLAFILNPETNAEAVSITAKYLETSDDETKSMIGALKLYSSQSSESAMKENGVAYLAIKNISDFYFERNIIPRKIVPEEIILK